MTMTKTQMLNRLKNLPKNLISYGQSKVALKYLSLLDRFMENNGIKDRALEAATYEARKKANSAQRRLPYEAAAQASRYAAQLAAQGERDPLAYLKERNIFSG